MVWHVTVLGTSCTGYISRCDSNVKMSTRKKSRSATAGTHPSHAVRTHARLVLPHMTSAITCGQRKRYPASGSTVKMLYRDMKTLINKRIGQGRLRIPQPITAHGDMQFPALSRRPCPRRSDEHPPCVVTGRVARTLVRASYHAAASARGIQPGRNVDFAHVRQSGSHTSKAPGPPNSAHTRHRGSV